MDVLIIGSVAYDSVSSPEGAVENALGGSATYAVLSAAFHDSLRNGGGVGLVGVVGNDFSDDDYKTLSTAGLDISGLEVADGPTFRWSGSYHGNMGEAQTHETHLNVFEHFQPKVPEESRTPKVTFCANLHPALQASVVDQTEPTRCTILDSMNLWIDIALDDLRKVMSRVDIVVLNDGEIRMLADDENLVRAAHTVREEMGGGILIVKRGEHGVLALHPEGMIALPAYPTATVVDPTGCGDTFAGTLSSLLATGDGDIGRGELQNALLHATVTASFTLMSFGVNAIANLNPEHYQERLESFKRIIGV